MQRKHLDVQMDGLNGGIMIIIFIYYNCSQTAQSYSTNICRAGRETTAATQSSTMYRRVKPAKLLPHTAHSD